MSLGSKIRELRQNLGWSQQKLADEAGIGHAYVSRLEGDGFKKPSADILLRLARALAVDVNQLYDAAGYVGERWRNNGLRPFADILTELHQRAKLLETVEVPIRGKVPATYPDLKEGTYGYLLIPRGLLPVNGRVFARQVDSDCLVGDGIHPQDYIIVDPQAPLVDGQIYLVRLPKGVAAGHVYMAEHKLRVSSSGGECFDIEVAEAEVLGRVVLAGSWRTY
jgi:repressor LexA